MPEEVLNQLVVVVVSFGWGGVGQLAAAFAAVLLLGLRRKYCGSSQVHLTKSSTALYAVLSVSLSLYILINR